MPELLNRSLDDMLEAMAARFGARWPNDWWPKGNAAYDDCAACVSYFLFGLNSLGNPFYSYVSQIQTWGRTRGIWHAGHAGVRRGDVLAFDWDGDGDPDHTEIVVSVSSGSSIVTSRGTNSNPGDDMRDRTRAAGYILSYIRPPYPGTTTAAVSGVTTIPTGDEIDMASLEDLNKIVGAAAADIKSAIRREARFRLFYSPNPPAGLPYYVAIDRDGEPGQNVLYANDLGNDQGAHQARQWKDAYFMTDDTVEQAQANKVDGGVLRKLVDFALRKDSAFTNNLAK